MKAILINPPHLLRLQKHRRKWVDDDEGRKYPPLGLLYVAAAARARTDWQVSVLDCQALDMSYEDLEKTLRQEQPAVIGIQAYTDCLVDVRQTMTTARQTVPDAHICVGGPHAHIFPEETLRLESVDTVVLGEGERTFAELLKGLTGPGLPEDLPGLAFLKEDKLVVNPPRFLEDLDALPSPDRTLLPVESYRSTLTSHNPITTMVTSRGCPHRCIFCDRPHLGKRFRARSAASVVDEMEDCASLGIGEIFIFDDTFTLDRARVMAICELIQARRVRVRFDLRARVNTVDLPMLRALRRAGCVRIHYGVEAGTQQIIDVLQKGFKLHQAEQAFRWTRRAGITTVGYFMIGNPTETPAQMEQTLTFARQLRPDFLHLSVTTPFPGTRLYAMGLEQGMFSDEQWRRFISDPDPDFEQPLWTEHLSREELNALRERANREFYLQPRYLLRSLLRVRSPREIWNKVQAGWRMLRSPG